MSRNSNEPFATAKSGFAKLAPTPVAPGSPASDVPPSLAVDASGSAFGMSVEQEAPDARTTAVAREKTGRIKW